MAVGNTIYSEAMTWNNRLTKAVQKSKATGVYRALKETPTDFIDFNSNDYLGFSKNLKFIQSLQDLALLHPQTMTGATGSRLISGNSTATIATESYIAKKHNSPSALLFPSGYIANLALFSSLSKRNTTFIIDESVHRSVHDGIRLGFGKRLKFRHNDMNHLEDLLKKYCENALVAVESLYSMDGDFAPIDLIFDLCKRYGAELIVDEAHAFGVFGYGICHELNLQDHVLANVVTYGKAFGLQGAAILGSSALKEYLVNYASPFIYTTAPSAFIGESIIRAYEFYETHPSYPQELQWRIYFFQQRLAFTRLNDKSPIQSFIIPSDELKRLQSDLQTNKIMGAAIFPPTVKPGTERLRICMHSFNTLEEIELLAKILTPYIQT